MEKYTMTFKSKLGTAALEEFKEVDVAGLNVGTEGWKGALAGAVGGIAANILLPGIGVGINAIASGAVKNQCEKLKKEIEMLSKEIEKAAETNGKKAISEGKLSAEDFKQHVNVGAKGVVSGFIYGSLFGPIYTAIKGSELEDLMEELASKTREMDKLLKNAGMEPVKLKTGKAPAKAPAKAAAKPGVKAAKEDNEGEDGDEAAAAAAADPAAKPEGTDETAPGTGEANPEGATGDDGVDATATSAAPAAGADDAAAAGADDTGAAAPGADDASADAGADAAAATADPDAAADPAADPAAAAVGEAAADDSAAAANAEATGEPDADAGMDADNAAADEIETEMDAVDDIDAQSADVDQDVEKLTAATESLEVTVSILNAAAQRGGLDIFGAALVRNNLNTVTTNLKVKKLMIPALEDMETPSAKIDGATSTSEQVVAFIKRILEALKQAFVRFGQWIVEAYKRLVAAFGSAEKRAEALAERVRTGKMVEGKIANASVAKKMVYGMKPVDDVLDAATKLGNFAHYLNDPKTYGGYLKSIDLTEEMVKDPSKEEELRGKISGELDRWAQDLEKHGKNVSGDARMMEAAQGGANPIAAAMGATEQSVIRIAVPMFDGQALGLIVPSAAEGLRIMRSQVIDLKPEAGGDIDALDQATAAKLCAIVAGIAKGLRESSEANKGGVKELVELIKKRSEVIVALGNANINKISDDLEAPALFRKSMVFVNTHMISAAKLPVHAINKAMPRNLSSLLDYVAASVAGKSEDMSDVNSKPGAAASAEPAKQLAAA